MVKMRVVDILYCDDSLLIVNKPAGFPVLPDGWQPDAPFLVQQIEQLHGKVWVVHRLDKGTSGVLALARDAEAHRLLSMQFEKHEAVKVYHALAQGAPTWQEKTARHPLTADVGHKHRTIVDRRKGKPSETTFRVLSQFRAHVLLEARPLTGRTHQVRAHLAALGFPLLGDLLYGSAPTQLITRPALHAQSLTFAHPLTRQTLSVAAPYPEDFKSALARLTAQER